MIKIKFNNKNVFIEVEFIRTGNNIILKGITDPNESGFTTYRLSGELLGDFSDFTTIFKKGEGFIEYSNDGSVYEEPIQLTEQELKKHKIESEISTLKHELSTYDYIGVKISMGVATKEEYAEQIEYTESLRQKIRDLESQLEI